MLLRVPASSIQLWEPPDDPDKQNLHHVPGFTSKIHRHIAPSSLFEYYNAGTKPRPHLSEEYLKTVTQSKAVVHNPPLETATVAQPETAQLTITSPLGIGPARDPQLVACTVTPHGKSETEITKSFHAAAKIYDPLYYSFKRDIGHYPGDCTYEADEDYSVEAAAYEVLQKGGQTGSFAPEYYGSWTLGLPINIDGESLTRPVPLVLIEHLNGTSIRDTRVQNNPGKQMGTDSFHYPEHYRLEVLARAMGGYVRQLSIGVSQQDFAGRNIVLGPPSTPVTGDSDTVSGLAMPRIVHIDYYQAEINSVPVPSRPVSPALAFWNECLWEDFGRWAPLEWEDDDVVHQWLLKRFYRDGRKDHYLPLPDYLVHEAESLISVGSGQE